MDDDYSDSDFEDESKPATKTKFGGGAKSQKSGGYYAGAGKSKPFTLADEDDDNKSLDFGDIKSVTKAAPPKKKVPGKAPSEAGSGGEDDYEDDDFDEEEEEMFKRTATEFAKKLKELQSNSKLLEAAKQKKAAAAMPTYIPPKANMNVPLQTVSKQAKAASLPYTIGGAAAKKSAVSKERGSAASKAD